MTMNYEQSNVQKFCSISALNIMTASLELCLSSQKLVGTISITKNGMQNVSYCCCECKDCTVSFLCSSCALLDGCLHELHEGTWNHV